MINLFKKLRIAYSLIIIEKAFNRAEGIFRQILDNAEKFMGKVIANWCFTSLYQKQNRVQEAKADLNLCLNTATSYTLPHLYGNGLT